MLISRKWRSEVAMDISESPLLSNTPKACFRHLDIKNPCVEVTSASNSSGLSFLVITLRFVSTPQE